MTLSEARRYQGSADPAVAAEARRVLEARRARAARVAPKRAAGRDEKKAATKERRQKVATLREAVMERANGACEVCHRPGYVLDLHHALSGPLRRLHESAETCLGICADCHRSVHRNDVTALRAMKETAIRLGLREALAAVDRRLAKIEGAP